MKQGTGRTVLVTDLMRSDGPYTGAADDFTAGRCSACRLPVADQDARFSETGYLCPVCWQTISDISRGVGYENRQSGSERSTSTRSPRTHVS